MAGASVDVGFLTDLGRFARTANEEEDDRSLTADHLEELHSYNFIQPPLSQPDTFCTDIKRSGEAPGLMDFKKGTTTLAFLIKDGAIVAVDARATMGMYISSSQVKKVIEINDRLLGTMAGGAADCFYWEHVLAMECRLHDLRQKDPISVAAASKILANIFFNYRGRGLACGTMVVGSDHKGTHIYYVDDEGNRYKGERFSVGSGSLYAYGLLDTHFKKDMTLEEGVDLGKRAIVGATYRDAGSGGVVRVYHVHKNGWTKIVAGEDVNTLIDEYGLYTGQGK